jgi:D-serine deaminase-like pyridoxal phosphate-dependent protein
MNRLNPCWNLHQLYMMKAIPRRLLSQVVRQLSLSSRERETIECSPGTFAYWDRGYELAFEEQPFQTAALIVARVISLPDETKVCIDVGHKSVSAENELSKRIYFLNAPELVFKGQSEEHLVADAGPNHHYKVGDILYGLPYHICPTIALYERAITVENQNVSGEWLNIARDRKINI